MTENIPEKVKLILISRIPMGKLGTGKDVSNCAAFYHLRSHLILPVKRYMLMVVCIWLDNHNE